MPMKDNWYMKFSDTEPVKNIPYDPKVKEVFKKYKAKLQKLLGKDTKIVHGGATALKISGQGEIDLYIVTDSNSFQTKLNLLKSILGEPGTNDPDWARFNDKVDGIEIEVMLVDKTSQDWTRTKTIFNYLKTHKKALKEYENLKKRYAQTSKREYYKYKYEIGEKILKTHS